MDRRHFGLSLATVSGAMFVPSIVLANDASCGWTIDQGLKILKDNKDKSVYFNTYDIAAICKSNIKKNEKGIDYVSCNDSDPHLMKFMKQQFGFDYSVPRNWVYVSKNIEYDSNSGKPILKDLDKLKKVMSKHEDYYYFLVEKFGFIENITKV